MHYTKDQQKALVRQALTWLEKYGSHPIGFFKETAESYHKLIKKYVPEGRDPLDWATEE